MQRIILLCLTEFLVGCITLGSASWFEYKSMDKVLTSHVPPPWVIHSWTSGIALLVGILVALMAGFLFSTKNRVRNVLIGLLAFFIGTIICAMFVPARG